MKKIGILLIATALVLFGCGEPAESAPEKTYNVWTETVQVDGQTVPCVVAEVPYRGVSISCNWNRG